MLLRRPVVAQPAPPPGAAPWPVGIVPFYAPEPRLGVLVKHTYELELVGNGTWTWAHVAAPEPLSLPVLSALAGAAEGELAYPGDFVPRKKATDVLITGHARAPRPSSRIHAALSVGPVSRAFCVATSGMTTKLPLTAIYLRGPDGESATSPLLAAAVPEMPAEHPDDFDYGVYGTAPASQQCEFLPPGSAVVLRGLFASAESIEARLPTVSARAALLSTHGSHLDVPLRCDTVWIHSDYELCVLVFRGDVALPPPDLFDLRCLVVWQDEPMRARTLDEVRRELPRGTFAFAATVEDLRGSTPPGDPAEIDLVRYGTLDTKPEPRITLEQYARISAELAEERWPRGDVLQRHALDEVLWLVEERGWLETMADKALQGDASLAAAYGDLFIDAQDALAEPWEKGQTVELYTTIKAAMEVTGDPHRVLGERTMRLATWMRLDRRFSRAAREDHAFGQTLEERLDEARAQVDVKDADAADDEYPAEES